MTKASANNNKQNKSVKSNRSSEIGSSQTFSSWLRVITQKSVNTVLKILSDAFYIPPPPKQLLPSEGSGIIDQSLTPLSLSSPVSQSISVNNVFGESQHQQPSTEPENSTAAMIIEPVETIGSSQSNSENVTAVEPKSTVDEDNAESLVAATLLTVRAPTATDSEIETQSQSAISDAVEIEEEDTIEESANARVSSTAANINS